MYYVASFYRKGEQKAFYMRDCTIDEINQICMLAQEKANDEKCEVIAQFVPKTQIFTYYPRLTANPANTNGIPKQGTSPSVLHYEQCGISAGD